MRPVIALLSDFGTRDHYAGTMKGVMLGICPDVTLVDITHDIPPHDVLERRAASSRPPTGTFPPAPSFSRSSIPGVGSARRGLAAEAGDYRFVAPDNGVLTAVLREMPPKRVVELTERRYARPTVSRTFEGRDRFAPAAAWLAKGIQLSALGRAGDRLPPARSPAAQARTTTAWAASCCASIASATSSPTSIAARSSGFAGSRRRDADRRRPPRSPASSRPTPRSGPRKSARSSAAPIISSSPPTAAAPPTALAVARGAVVEVTRGAL